MSIFKYIYNVSFIIFFAIVMSRCSVTYGMTQRRGFKLMGQLFLAYIIESVYVELVEIMYAVSPEFEGYLLAGIDVYASAFISAAEIYIFGSGKYRKGRCRKLFSLQQLLPSSAGALPLFLAGA